MSDRRLTVGMVAAMPWPAAKASSIRAGNILRALLDCDPELFVELFAYEGGSFDPHPRLRVHRVSGFDADKARYYRWRNKLVADLGLLGALRAARERIDVLYAHTFEGLAIALAFKASTRRRVPICADLHGPFVPELVHYGMIPDRRLARAPFALLETALLRACDHVFASNEGLAETIAAKIGRERTSVLFDYVDLALFDPARIDPLRIAELEARFKPPGTRLVAYVGMFKDYQGVDGLVRAFAAIAPRYPDLRLLLVGDGPCRSDYERIARARGIADRLLMPGLVPHADVVHWLRLADVLVSPRVDNSITRSGFVSQMPEYMAAGKPIVSTPVSGCAFLLRDDAGILVPSDDDAALAEGIERALALSEDARAAMVARARANVARFTWRENIGPVAARLRALAARSVRAAPSAAAREAP
ncbi:MAG: glycosyltransferase family 4 protein [Geminicoccaceae bacterium]|nr:glycosyltransferase family 4 protein [Geminicoccaceae bacterium]MCX7629813.1 glycosyltransferase family 4 protein [Geminicoccaceae bacterium]MDW8341418.1 glycosyltransferase family 4 protein [Geminicoccaceae bacterium]